MGPLCCDGVAAVAERPIKKATIYFDGCTDSAGLPKIAGLLRDCSCAESDIELIFHGSWSNLL